MAKAMKITDRTFLVFRQENDINARYRKSEAIGRYVVVFDSDDHWMLMWPDDFEKTFRFIDRESPNGYSQVEINTK